MASWLRRFQNWRANQRSQSLAIKSIDDLFTKAALLKQTSLKPHHRSRCVYLRHGLTESGAIHWVEFGILRHPRPYAFSQQSHKVIEQYRYDVQAQTIERLGGLNLTRQDGKDAD